MATIRRSALSEQDYRDIWRYIAGDNRGAADALLRRIDSKLELYAHNPRMGTARGALARGLRSFPIGNYVAFYRIAADGIELVRVLHGARVLKTLLNS